MYLAAVSHLSQDKALADERIPCARTFCSVSNKSLVIVSAYAAPQPAVLRMEDNGLREMILKKAGKWRTVPFPGLSVH